MRATALAVALALTPALPEACRRPFEKNEVPAAPPPPPPLAPNPSATTPPVWTPPDPRPGPSPPQAISPELANARALAQDGEHKKVRTLLERKVKAGKASNEEGSLLMEACVALRDRPCVKMIKAKYPSVEVPESSWASKLE